MQHPFPVCTSRCHFGHACESICTHAKSDTRILRAVSRVAGVVGHKEHNVLLGLRSSRVDGACVTGIAGIVPSESTTPCSTEPVGTPVAEGMYVCLCVCMYVCVCVCVCGFH